MYQYALRRKRDGYWNYNNDCFGPDVHSAAMFGDPYAASLHVARVMSYNPNTVNSFDDSEIIKLDLVPTGKPIQITKMGRNK